MSVGLVALLDDIAAIAKVAAASLDDVAGQAAKAGAKAAGVVIDDAAVTPRYVTGFSAERELPIVGKIALGSVRNKLLFLLPAALLLSLFAPWAITPLLMLGGAYLCYEGTEKVYELDEALDVAIESALKLHRSFSPDISRTVDGEVSLAAPDLVFITDAVLVVFSNINTYSKLENPAVEIHLRHDPDEETLSVEIINEVASKARSAAQDRRLEELTRAVASGVTDKRARTEGGSGFLKLAAVVQQSVRGGIEFGYVAPTRFRTLVRYSMIVDPVGLADAA